MERVRMKIGGAPGRARVSPAHEGAGRVYYHDDYYYSYYYDYHPYCYYLAC